jgi:dGTPase
VITRRDLPEDCRRVLGDTNGTIVYTLVEDLVANSLDKPYVTFHPEVSEALRKLKTFNQDFIYTSHRVKTETPKIELMFQLLFEKYLHDLETQNQASDIYTQFLAGMSHEYGDHTTHAETVRDFIAGMTDDYFLAQCKKNLIPQVKSKLDLPPA